MTSREFIVCPATLDHAMAILPHIRPEDRAEWVAGTGDPTRLRLAAAVENHKGFARSVFVSDVDHPLLIWGAGEVEGRPGTGQAWLIASVAALPYAIGLHSILPEELPILDMTFPHSVAYADQRNVVHHRWLQWLGFERVGLLRLGPWRLPFYQYERSTQHVPTGTSGGGRRHAGRGLHGGGLGGCVGEGEDVAAKPDQCLGVGP